MGNFKTSRRVARLLAPGSATLWASFLWTTLCWSLVAAMTAYAKSTSHRFWMTFTYSCLIKRCGFGLSIPSTLIELKTLVTTACLLFQMVKATRKSYSLVASRTSWRMANCLLSAAQVLAEEKMIHHQELRQKFLACAQILATNRTSSRFNSGPNSKTTSKKTHLLWRSLLTQLTTFRRTRSSKACWHWSWPDYYIN